MKKLTKIFALICALICLSVSAVACSNEKYTYWQTERKVAGETTLKYTAEITFGSSTVKVSEIWINLSNVDFDPKLKTTVISLELVKSSSSSDKSENIDYTLTSDELKKSKDGWIRIYFATEDEEDDASPISCNSALLKIVDKMHVNEICFINNNGKLISVNFSKAGVVAGKSSNLYSKDELEALTEGYVYDKNGNYAFNLVDEQDKFPLEYIKTPVKD